MILHMRHTLWTGISETNVNIITSATRPHAFNNNKLLSFSFRFSNPPSENPAYGPVIHCSTPTEGGGTRFPTAGRCIEAVTEEGTISTGRVCHIRTRRICRKVGRFRPSDPPL